VNGTPDVVMPLKRGGTMVWTYGFSNCSTCHLYNKYF
jgi:hypothetical protein